jgi:pyridine nucleotide-disulfide oxidoreductase family protein
LKRLVLLGGGHAHVEVLRSLALLPARRWEVTLVSPTPWLTYSGMVPGQFAGHYDLDDCTVDLRRLCDRARARLMISSATLVSPGANEVMCSNATVLPYEVLSVNVGGAPDTGGAQGLERHAFGLRPLEAAIKAWREVLTRAGEGRMAAVTVVGGGPAAVELALAMNYRFRHGAYDVVPHVRVLGDAPVLAPSLPAGARASLDRRLRKAGIEAHTDSHVTEVGPGYLRLKSGLEFATDAVFWATGIAAPAWIRQSGFATDDRGFLLVNDLLQSPSHPNVFGAGDCVSQLGRPLPKAGVFAVRAGPALAANLMAALEHGELVPHLPKARHLAIVSAGEKYAVAAWGGLSASGAWVWRWKDRIDRRFIARYRDLPPAARIA